MRGAGTEKRGGLSFATLILWGGSTLKAITLILATLLATSLLWNVELRKSETWGCSAPVYSGPTGGLDGKPNEMALYVGSRIGDFNGVPWRGKGGGEP